jgi:hypothetical protein
MSRKVPIIVGLVLGVIHFALVGVPFIQSKGGGEALAYQILFIDFPLYVVAEVAFQRLLLNSVPFNFFWFVVLGTIMYFLIGYGVGVLFNRATRKTNAET